MSGMTTTNTDVLIRSQIWSDQLKQTLIDNLESIKYVNWIDFKDGTVLNIPSIGDLDAYDYTEDTAIEYTPMALGNFQFSVNQYKASATYITNKARQDLHYAAQLEAAFLPKEERAIMVAVENHVLKQGQPGTPNGQTAGSANRINGADHRWVGSDTTPNSAATNVRALGMKDFAKARFALKKANVPDTNLIAMVDPSFEYYFNTQAGFLNVNYNPQYEGIVSKGVASGMRFLANIYGFDVYMSNYLPTVAASETINTVSSGANSVANLFFSADSSVKPWVGAWRQMPKVDGEYNKDFQREEYVTTARYDAALYRPENFITVLSQTDIVV
jgi:hypothetical protein